MNKFIEMGWYNDNGLFVSNLKGEPLGDRWICNKEHYNSIFKSLAHNEPQRKTIT